MCSNLTELVATQAMQAKLTEIRWSLHDLGKKLEAGDDSELLVWVIPKALACAHRPLRHHPRFGGSGLDLPSESAVEVRDWVRRIKKYGIHSIICLMHPR